MVLPDLHDFAKREELALVLLFGSQAGGSGRPDSDFDLALLPSVSDAEPQGIEERLIHLCKRSDLDFLWLPHASPLARERVAAQAQLLYEDQPNRFRQFLQDASLRQFESRQWAESDRRFVKRTLERNWKVDTSLLSRKLAQISSYLEQLEEIMEASEADFARDFRIHRVAERQIELLVEAAGKVNTEVAQAVAKIPPADYYSSFFSVASTGWVDTDVATRLAALAGLRNRLVHQYEDIRLPQLYKACRQSLPDWRLYLTSLLAHLEGYADGG